MKKYLLTIIALQIVTLFTIIGAKSYAASYTVHNDEPLTLRNSITSTTQTSNIVFIAPYINGEYQTFATQSGGILELVSGSRNKKELIYYSSASVDQTLTTKDVTLSGVVRAYCANNATDSQTWGTCGDSKAYTWARGTKATLSPDMRLFNLSAKRDIRNNYHGSGINICMSKDQPCFAPNQLTTAERDAMTDFLTGAVMIWNKTELTAQYYNPSTAQWINFGSGSTVAAGYGNSGSVELATPTEIFAGTASGSSNAGLVPAVKDIITESAGATSSGRLVALSGATFDTSVLGTGSADNNVFLRGDGTWSVAGGVYGDCSDGDVTISSNTNLTSDKKYNNLTIDNTFVLDPKGFKISVCGTLTLSGNIESLGSDGASGASGGSGGAGAHTGGSLPDTTDGGAGGAGGTGGIGGIPGENGTSVTGNTTSNAIGGNGASGGSGGAGGDENGGISGGTGGGSTAGAGTISDAEIIGNSWILYPSYTTSHTMNGNGGSAGGGGGGEGGDGSTNGPGGRGGGGGGNGGNMDIAASIITGAGDILATGGAGGDGLDGGDGTGDNGGSGGGGGGAGGGGGFIRLYYSTITGWSGDATAASGVGGTGGAKGLGAGGGADGVAGSNGGTKAGIVHKIQF